MKRLALAAALALSAAVVSVPVDVPIVTAASDVKPVNDAPLDLARPTTSRASRNASRSILPFDAAPPSSTTTTAPPPPPPAPPPKPPKSLPVPKPRPAPAPSASPAGEDGPAEGWRLLGTFKSTCYQLRGTTASGASAGPGRIAVDPSVIRLGTQLYVESYGHATASDTGGAIKGNRIDVWKANCSGYPNAMLQVWAP